MRALILALALQLPGSVCQRAWCVWLAGNVATITTCPRAAKSLTKILLASMRSAASGAAGGVLLQHACQCRGAAGRHAGAAFVLKLQQRCIGKPCSGMKRVLISCNIWICLRLSNYMCTSVAQKQRICCADAAVFHAARCLQRGGCARSWKAWGLQLAAAARQQGQQQQGQ